MNKEEMADALESVWECRHACQRVLYDYCLKKGGPYAELAHVRTMTDCIEICQTAADFLTRQSPHHNALCSACAEICEACAQSCDALRDEEMDKCSKTCRACAQSCRLMAAHGFG